ncbi:MAG TPA: hypothetical protein VLB46_01875 [Pyrinomonadaceae bacterium]|nr:hypothetical protein [Pyrinomonadaceae bacterium]
MPDFPELLELRNKLWDKIRSFPGVITVGIGSSENESALVIFVDENTVNRSDLPTQYENVPVVLETGGKIKAHGD